jgi:hypothetical protein
MDYTPEEPVGWRILKHIMFVHMQLVSIKQQKDNPRNVVIALKPRMALGRQKDTATRLHQTLHFVGVLDEKHEEFEHLHVIRQNYFLSGEFLRSPEGEKMAGDRQQNFLEATKFQNFVIDFVEENKVIHPTDPKFGRSFPDLYKKASMIAIDTSCTASFGEHAELFAFRCPAPENCIKFYEYDFHLNELRQVYEIPIDPLKIETMYDIQLARVSEEDLSYAVFLDFAKHKELYFLSFDRSRPRPSVAPKHCVYRVKGSLVGKINLLTPKFSSAYSVQSSTLKFKINQ